MPRFQVIIYDVGFKEIGRVELYLFRPELEGHHSRFIINLSEIEVLLSSYLAVFPCGPSALMLPLTSIQ